MRDTVYFLVFDGFADWQAALALCEIQRPGDWQVATVGFTLAPVRSMGGLTVQPECALAELEPTRAAMLIVPGGHLWQHPQGASAVALLRRAHAAGAVVAGIDSGVLPLARAGLLDHCRHTGNWPGQLSGLAPDYRGAEHFDPAVLATSDGGTITASHLGSVEFAHQVIRTLELYSPAEGEHWFGLFKHARWPPSGALAVA